MLLLICAVFFATACNGSPLASGEKKCLGEGTNRTECVIFSRCSSLDTYEVDLPDYVLGEGTCGFDDTVYQTMICCEPDRVKDTPTPVELPSVPQESGEPYECKKDPAEENDGYEYIADRCGNKGCVDESPFCYAWACSGYCYEAEAFMSHTCRETCRACGNVGSFDCRK